MGDNTSQPTALANCVMVTSLPLGTPWGRAHHGNNDVGSKSRIVPSPGIPISFFLLLPSGGRFWNINFRDQHKDTIIIHSRRGFFVFFFFFLNLSFPRGVFAPVRNGLQVNRLQYVSGRIQAETTPAGPQRRCVFIFARPVGACIRRRSVSLLRHFEAGSGIGRRPEYR